MKYFWTSVDHLTETIESETTDKEGLLYLECNQFQILQFLILLRESSLLLDKDRFFP